ncbi:MAG: alkyl sulfatase dimerization domain-containing protein [Acidobacteriota bacterium]|nr:alkyl sulfatase dimerization domain-containing protein [Acidobacteriota bacterium]
MRYLIGLSFLLLSACGGPERVAFEKLETPEGLAELNASFEKRVEKVTDGVYAAIGYGLANSIMIEGTDGVVVVDTMETTEAAREVLAAFREITQKPVAAVVYTHNHADHVFGSGVFTEGVDVPVYAHETTGYYIDRIINMLRPIITQRSMRMFGSYLEGAATINDGIGLKLEINEDSTFDIIRPTHTFSDELEVTAAGIRMKLVAAPGETNDQIFVWLPDKKVLMPGDNIYRAFPNLYTIRGTPYRDVNRWIESLDKMRALKPEFLAPSHTNIIRGADKIYEELTNYRDGIQYVHDQTIRLINLGLKPDELVEAVKLPPHLASSQYLQEYYGTVAWSVRSIFDGNLGWFDGNPTNLFPLPPKEKARKYAELAGGIEALEVKVAEALAKGEHQWVLELTDYLLVLNPKSKKARDARIQALVKLGGAQSNPNARHYYLTRAGELDQGIKIKQMGSTNKRMIHDFPMAGFFTSLRVTLNPEKSADVDQKVAFHFPDTGEDFSIHVRRGIAEVQPYKMENPDIQVTVDSRIFKEMAAGLRNKALTLAKDFKIEGGTFDLVGFFRMFEPVAE